MLKLVTKYGVIAGLTVLAGMALTMLAGVEGGILGMALGYLSMLVSLSFVFAGIKRYRDDTLGGVIRFGTALAVGSAIAGVASAFYVLGWEAYLFSTGYSFAPSYAASMIAAKQAAGVSAAELARVKAEAASFVESYANPLFRMLMTLSEIAPVAILVTLVSAALLRRPTFLPANR